jgi:hypothetical protein
MARPHIEFIQSQVLPWAEDGLTGRPGVAVKILSKDQDAGELSAILRYPSGYRQSSEVLAADEEFFVLDGYLEHRGRVHGPDSYGFWPRGFPREAVAAPTGAIVLTFLSGPLLPAAQGSTFKFERLVEQIDIREGDWTADIDAMGLSVMASRARIRQLRSDPDSGEMTYITATMPYWRECQPERHPVIQEIFVLAGEVAGNTGLMQAGAYTWRPAHVLHGPYGSTTGAVFFFRSRGGPLTTEHESPVTFSFDPPHRPILPPELQLLGRDRFPTRGRA